MNGSGRIVLTSGSYAVAVLILAGCATASPQVDYHHYGSADELIDAADVVAAVTILATRQGELVAEWSGDDPEENPYAGDAPSDPPADPDTVALNLFDAQIDSSYKGSAVLGEVREISQMPDVAGLSALEVGESYVLFLSTEVEGPAAILGGDQGMYAFDGTDLVPVDAEDGLALTLDDLDAIAAEED